ncbi:LysE/ArgO family amino acid transporter [Pseudogemmobacter bohemicus]|uniref:LysE/ArgO family amino acid transporter n=1 Tax=Pseudogemmobacter bohemicus TaxID=2250708 RepID=UPI000DD4013C|nr:LysE/ArgO family amino acid transporter [Pseudogemmobacter bohemicus]
MFEAIIAGYFTALSLILAIGAQNAFVLRQGLRREYVGLVVAICAISDAVLITLGVAGFGAMSRAAPWLVPVMKWGGVAFLLFYGALRFRAAMRGGEALVPSASAPVSRRSVVVTCLLLTWANPHVWLDTVVLLGSVSAQHEGQRLAFGIAAAMGSFSFFSALGFGARFLAPVFAKPRAWVVLEIGVGLVMWTIAATLAFS